MWTHQDSIDTLADPATVWRFFADVPGWQRWNAGIARIEIHGPFAAGTQFFMAINLSGESLRSPQFREQFYKTLANHKPLAPRLWIEISETGAFENFLDFLAFCHLIRPLGCHLGIEHFGHRFSNIGQLYQTGLEYIKVDGSFIQDLDSKPGNQIFLKGLCGIAHGIGLQVIGENTRTQAEMEWLEKLGFDGVTGPVLA